MPTRRLPPLWVRTRDAMTSTDRAVKDAISDVESRRQEREARLNCRPFASIDVKAGEDTEAPTERETDG